MVSDKQRPWVGIIVNMRHSKDMAVADFWSGGCGDGGSMLV